MTDIRFYHLMQKRLEQALPELVAKAVERGHRVLVLAGSPERVETLDSALWTADPGSFIPHSALRDAHAAEQPVVLTTEDKNVNGATVLMLTDGAASGAVADYAMCCEIFDGRDEDAVTAARSRWKSYKDAGHTLAYYQQNDMGRWEQKQ
jgi:DNA polymerase-3 subunit chi